jgi:hypothetical protein
MKVFASSTYQDLAEHWVAAIRALRRLGYEVSAMEDFTAAIAYPLARVLSLVWELTIIGAWRYGFIPDPTVLRSLTYHVKPSL